MPNTAPNVIEVAVGVIKNADGEILIALRDNALHQGGLWEFSGGKIEAGESAAQALARELHEEIGINVLSATPLISIPHCYGDKQVMLRVFEVNEFSGEPRGCLGQPLRWVKAANLQNYDFPAANRPIIAAATVPPHYAILDDAPPAVALANLQRLLTQGITLIQARLKSLSQTEADAFIAQAYPLCQQHGALLLLNSAMRSTQKTDGVHLTSRDLMALNHRPPALSWLAASCHNAQELQHAQIIGVDFVVLAPVLMTQSHPDTPPLGWEKFAELVENAVVPVYALGGMTMQDVVKARQAGGQGIAAIRAFLTHSQS